MISSFTLWSSRTTSSRISYREQGLRHGWESRLASTGRGASRGGLLGFTLTLAHPHSSLPKPGWRVHCRWGTLASPGASTPQVHSGGEGEGRRGCCALLMAGAGDKCRDPPPQLAPG